MHIPDGFLSTPVWATLNLSSAPTLAYLARRAQREFDHHKIPLMGVMGAFVFAAQMINFPVGNGTSGHLLGGALLSFTLGPAAAAMVMTAILATQALVFQDGGLLALGANVFNMAIAGVLAGYLPYLLLRGAKAAVFFGGFLSVLVSATLALVELRWSGVPMPRGIVGVSLSLFLISALAEAGITLVVVQSLERMQPGLLLRPSQRANVGAVAVAAGFMVVIAAVAASSLPDGIQSLTRVPSAGAEPVLPAVLAGLGGLVLIYCICGILSRFWFAARPSLKREGL